MKNNAVSHRSHATFNPVRYVPLQKKYFDTIAVKLMTDVGERMPFVVGKSILVIEFRRCAHMGGASFLRLGGSVGAEARA